MNSSQQSSSQTTNVGNNNLSDNAGGDSLNTQESQQSGGTTSQKPADTQIDLDDDGISDDIEAELISRFAPIIKLHSEETYLPADISWYLGRVRMRFNVSFGPDAQLLDHGYINITNLLSQEYKSQASGLFSESTDFFLEQTDSKGGDDLDSYRLTTRKGSSPADWKCYAHVRPASDYAGMYDIQYIFFYAYNGDLLASFAESAHEADFEHITVRVEDDLTTIYKIYYAAHDNEGKWYDYQSSPETDNGYSLSDTNRPIVFSALDSHASYPWAQEWDRNNLPDDITDDAGLTWDSLNNITNLGEKYHPLNDNEWIQYSGRWGEIGETSFTKGPFGPAYQSWWDAD